jgi:hypothetical protein
MSTIAHIQDIWLAQNARFVRSIRNRQARNFPFGLGVFADK